MDEIRRDPIKWFIEGFGVLTGGFFVLSGLANAISFYLLWRLNYFLIASPSDVVMSAFIFGLIVVVGVSVIMIVGGGAYWLMRTVGLHVPPTLLAGSLGDWISELLSKALEERTFRETYDRIMRTLLAMALAAGAINLAVWAISGAPRDWGKVLRPFWYETGLNVATDSPVAEACKGAHVAWLGASAAVLECRDRTHVLHKLDDLQTERRFGEIVKPTSEKTARAGVAKPPPPPPPRPEPKITKKPVLPGPSGLAPAKGGSDGG